MGISFFVEAASITGSQLDFVDYRHNVIFRRKPVMDAG